MKFLAIAFDLFVIAVAAAALIAVTVLIWWSVAQWL